MRQRNCIALIHAVAAPPSSDPVDRAIARCRTAYTSTYQQCKDNRLSEYETEKRAGEQFKLAMPSLGTRDNIRAFVACVAHGVLINVMDGTEAARMLFAAQVALSTLKTGGWKTR
jgi:hypothetical protein